jgi:hypothetical protein
MTTAKSEVQLLPEIVHEGQYRLYKLPNGGLHLVYLIAGETEERHMEIPGALIALAEGAANGEMSPMDMMKGAMSLMNSGGNPFG